MKSRNWFWGIFFILAAVFVIASQLGSFVEIGFVSLLATVLLIAFLIQSLINVEFFGIFISVALLYLIYQQPFDLPHISFWLLILSAVFISIGFSIIFRSHTHRKWRAKHEEWHQCKQTVESIDDNNPVVNVHFGSSSKYLHADSLMGGQFTVSFGALEVYFDQVTLSPEGAEIYVDCSLGSLSLFIPKTWRVVDNLHTSLGAVENDIRIADLGENAPKLTISGNVHLGNIDIRYI